jgi:hypothetical protein
MSVTAYLIMFDPYTDVKHPQMAAHNERTVDQPLKFTAIIDISDI